ncbi:hypothetical protein C922_01536 [Plasmodium inui San Antonio 1]|uniref:SET domain-containing protein n=1 Tax=Plasmodium inui San Antonio 1 TaxID=1237626 RepID=W7AFV8_9APIC|nr:hypothetical protein C922_01536 [Plasmodium inui San Antonio 1]EUD67924.1 hypothetical protein C922_01536 [Plasmodium inui San Antonio 1]
MANNPNEVEFCSRVIKWQGKNDECNNNQRNESSPKVWFDYYNDVVRDDLKDVEANTLFNMKRHMLTKKIYPKNKNSALLLHNPFDFNLKRTHHGNEGKGHSSVRSAHSNVGTERKKNFLFEDFVWNNELKRYVKLEQVDRGQHRKHGKNSGTPRGGFNCGNSTRRSNSCVGLDNRAGTISHQRESGTSQAKYTRLRSERGVVGCQQKNGPVAIPAPPVEAPSVWGGDHPRIPHKKYRSEHPSVNPNGHPKERHGDDTSAHQSVYYSAAPNSYRSACPNEYYNANLNSYMSVYPNEHQSAHHNIHHRGDPTADPSAFLAAYQRGYHSAEPSTYTSSNYNAAVLTYPKAPTPDVAHQIEENLKRMILSKSQALKNDTMRNNHGENILMVQDEKTGRVKIVANKRIEIGQVIFIEECVLETSIQLEHLWDTFNSLDNEKRRKLDKICEYMNMGRENKSGAHKHAGVAAAIPTAVAKEELPKSVGRMTGSGAHTTGQGDGRAPRVISYCRSGENTHEKYTGRIAHRTSTRRDIQDSREEKKKKSTNGKKNGKTNGKFVHDLIKFETFTDILKNSFISPKDKTEIMLFQYASLLSHSCFPNASYSYIDINKICFISMRTINMYEEITISLIDELYASIQHRRSKLNEIKNDTCFCNRCSQIMDEERHILCPLCKYSYVRKEADLKYGRNSYHNGGRNTIPWGDESQASSVGAPQGRAIQTAEQTHKQVMSIHQNKVGTNSGTSPWECTPFTEEKVHLQKEVNKRPYLSSDGGEGGMGYYSGTPNKMGGITKKNTRKTGINSDDEPSMCSVSKMDKEQSSMYTQNRMPNARIISPGEDPPNWGEAPVGQFNMLRFERGLNIANIMMLIWNTQNERNEIGCCKFHNNEELWICDTCGEAVSSCALPVESEENFTKEYKRLRDIISSNQFDRDYNVEGSLNTIERSLVYIIGILGEKHWLYASFNYLMADFCFSVCCYSSDESNWDRYLLKGFNSFQNFLWFIQTRCAHSIHTDLVPLVLKFFLVCIYTCNYKTLYEFARSGFLELIRQKYGPWNIPFMCLYLAFQMCYAHINGTLPICREILLVLADMTRVRLFGELPR